MIPMMTRTSGLTAIAMLAALFTVAGCSEENENGEQAATAPAPAESSSATSGAVSAEPAPDAGGADDGADTAETTKTAAADVSTETSTDSATGETAAADAAEPAAQSSAETTETPDQLPEALIGRWGMVPADCTSTRGDAKGLLEIRATELEFYESTGRLDTIKEYEPTRVVATFDFTGEGQTWSREMVLDVQDDGETLIRRENGADAASGPFEYSACAAATDGG